MVARPTQVPSWGTDGGRRLEPSSGKKASGFLANSRTGARVGNWLVGLLGDWAAWLSAIIDTNEEHTYQVAKSRTVLISPHDGAGESGWTNGSFIDHRNCSTDSADYMVDIGKYLRTGMVLSTVKALYKSANAPATGATLKIYKTALENAIGTPADPADTQLGSTATQALNNSFQVLTVGTIGETIDRSEFNYTAWVTASDAADSGAGDDYYGLQLTMTDPGPRNV